MIVICGLSVGARDTKKQEMIENERYVTDVSGKAIMPCPIKSLSSLYPDSEVYLSLFTLVL